MDNGDLYELLMKKSSKKEFSQCSNFYGSDRKGVANMKKKNNLVCTISAYEMTMKQKERFNPYQCGTGAFGTDKHMNRAKRKAQFRKELRDY